MVGVKAINQRALRHPLLARTFLQSFRLQTEEGKDEEERGQEGDDDQTPAARKDRHHHGYVRI